MRVGVLIAHSEPSCWQTLEDRCMCPAPLPGAGMSAYQEKLTPNYRDVVSVCLQWEPQQVTQHPLVRPAFWIQQFPSDHLIKMNSFCFSDSAFVVVH